MQDPLDRVKPRNLEFLTRCYECKSPDTPLLRRRPAMFQPEHRWGACDVRMPTGGECGCKAGIVRNQTGPDWLT